MDLKDIVDLVKEQEKNEAFWNSPDELRRALRELHGVVKDVLDTDKLKKTFCRLYGDPMLQLVVHNTVFTKVDVDLLDPLASPGSEEFQKELYESIKRSGVKDPFFLHFVTNCPIGHRHGYLIKTGNNRYLIAKKLGIKEIPAIVTNLSGECFGTGNWNEPFVEGEILVTEADVRKHYFTSKVEITFRDGKIVNAYTPYFLRCKDMYR